MFKKKKEVVAGQMVVRPQFVYTAIQRAKYIIRLMDLIETIMKQYLIQLNKFNGRGYTSETNKRP